MTEHQRKRYDEIRKKPVAKLNMNDGVFLLELVRQLDNTIKGQTGLGKLL